MTTRAKKQEAFVHLLETVLEQEKSGPLMQALSQGGYDTILDDLCTMLDEEIKELAVISRKMKL